MTDYILKLNKIQNWLMCSRARLADYLGVDRAQVTRWLDGVAMPSQENIEKINKLYAKFSDTA